jgi:hypothetical protein
MLPFPITSSMIGGDYIASESEYDEPPQLQAHRVGKLRGHAYGTLQFWTHLEIVSIPYVKLA